MDIPEILSANSGGLRESGEAGDTRPGPRCSGEPPSRTQGVHGRARAGLLQSGLGQADVAAATHAEGAHAEGAHALRERALDAGAHAVVLLPGRIAHPRPRRVQRLVLRTRMEVDRATPGLRRRAQLPGGAGAAVGAAEHGLDAWGADLVQAGTPGHRRLAPRTGGP